MLKESLSLKQRIFGVLPQIEENIHNLSESKIIENFSLEEILESLARQDKQDFVIFKDVSERINPAQLDSTLLFIEEPDKKKPKFVLYQIFENSYYVYSRSKRDSIKENSASKKVHEEESSYGLFAPTGVVVRRVPQNILGNGVLGRAFIHSNYIEILDSLMGNEYQEVLTHEVLHIMYPEKREMEIRQITRNYIGNTIYH